MHVTVNCQSGLLNTRSQEGKLTLEDDSKLSLKQCIFTNYYAGEAMTFDASTSKNVDTSLFGSNPKATVSMQSSFLEVPCSVWICPCASLQLLHTVHCIDPVQQCQTM